jgi:hypothetical protein
MKKYFKIIFVLVMSLVLMSCGFKKINQKANNLIYVQNINITGDKRFAYILKNNIFLISNKNSNRKYDVRIKIEKIKTNKIKNKAGKVTRYNLNIITNLSLINIDNKKTIKKKIERNRDYEIGPNHSDTIKNEKYISSSIYEQLSGDIVNFITLSMRYE